MNFRISPLKKGIIHELYHCIDKIEHTKKSTSLNPKKPMLPEF